MTKNNDTRHVEAHTPTPWRYVDESTPGDAEIGLRNFAIESGDGAWDIASLLFNEANARRICAAVNACQGIPTEALEQGIVRQLVEVLEDLYN